MYRAHFSHIHFICPASLSIMLVAYAYQPFFSTSHAFHHPNIWHILPCDHPNHIYRPRCHLFCLTPLPSLLCFSSLSCQSHSCYLHLRYYSLSHYYHHHRIASTCHHIHLTLLSSFLVSITLETLPSCLSRYAKLNHFQQTTI
jgi:hypothetical protein